MFSILPQEKHVHQNLCGKNAEMEKGVGWGLNPGNMA
jgi:hypothetical protein